MKKYISLLSLIAIFFVGMQQTQAQESRVVESEMPEAIAKKHGITLTELSLVPAIIMSIFPALTFLISLQRAVLVYSRNTSPLTTATIIEVVLILVVLFVGISYFNLVGVLAATTAYVTGRLLANTYLTFPYRKSVAKFS